MPRKPAKKASLPRTVSTDEGLLRVPEVLELYPVGESSWWKDVTDGRYPRPVRLGPRTVAWRVRDIRQLLASPEPDADQP